jgi:hypothetical protein
MRKVWIAGLALVAVLAIPAVSRAHEGHAHKVMGTVTGIEAPHVIVKTTDGKTVMVMWDAKTKFTRGKTKVDATAVKVGDRVVAEGPEDKSMIMATSVQLGAAPATTAKK